MRHPRQTTRSGSGPGVGVILLLAAVGFIGLAVFVGFGMGGNSLPQVGGPEFADPPPPAPAPAPTVTSLPSDKTSANTQQPAPHRLSVQPEDTAEDVNEVFELIAKEAYEKAEALSKRSDGVATPEIQAHLKRILGNYPRTSYAPRANALLESLKQSEVVRNAWVVKGFPNNNWAGHDIAYGPEKQPFDQNAVFDGPGYRATWQKAGVVDGYWFNFLPGENQVAYSYFTMNSPVSQKMVVFFGSDDTAKVWVNGLLVHEHPTHRGLTRGEDSFSANLQAGRNEILVKVSQGGGDWQLSFDYVVKEPVSLRP